jgi:hypothetical protein
VTASTSCQRPTSEQLPFGDRFPVKEPKFTPHQLTKHQRQPPPISGPWSTCTRVANVQCITIDHSMFQKSRAGCTHRQIRQAQCPKRAGYDLVGRCFCFWTASFLRPRFIPRPIPAAEHRGIQPHWHRASLCCDNWTVCRWSPHVECFSASMPNLVLELVDKSQSFMLAWPKESTLRPGERGVSCMVPPRTGRYDALSRDAMQEKGGRRSTRMTPVLLIHGSILGSDCRSF